MTSPKPPSSPKESPEVTRTPNPSPESSPGLQSHSSSLGGASAAAADAAAAAADAAAAAARAGAQVAAEADAAAHAAGAAASDAAAAADAALAAPADGGAAEPQPESPAAEAATAEPAAEPAAAEAAATRQDSARSSSSTASKRETVSISTPLAAAAAAAAAVAVGAPLSTAAMAAAATATVAAAADQYDSPRNGSLSSRSSNSRCSEGSRRSSLISSSSHSSSSSNRSGLRTPCSSPVLPASSAAFAYKAPSLNSPKPSDLSPRLLLPMGGSSSGRSHSPRTNSDLESMETDARVTLFSPEGPVPINIWDLKKLRHWNYDQYQELRREYLKQKASPVVEERAFAVPHPGVDYFYYRAPFLSHAGPTGLTAAAAQCLLSSGARLSADTDLRRTLKERLQAHAELDRSLTRLSCLGCL
ncbi:hypothetical protein, conserved [Eimeria tenella]|uniref:Uncharacterized protein n=1 Tax=Eimeria tenella TaxID=5802 RepID=U6L495_EIMTE|nr:hypothetical protein, conserved [Eimeria tenella]CDJ44966.1 hypothetical protein, conserved [Eimeria tenella]|eukprot:XP_013235713.1 hypothetical protein, conserved [Eimeria tenella]